MSYFSFTWTAGGSPLLASPIIRRRAGCVRWLATRPWRGWDISTAVATCCTIAMPSSALSSARPWQQGIRARGLEVGLLHPLAVLAKLVAVIAPKHDDSVARQLEPLQRVEQ